jgi:hypothetical protein
MKNPPNKQMVLLNKNTMGEFVSKKKKVIQHLGANVIMVITPLNFDHWK